MVKIRQQGWFYSTTMFFSLFCLILLSAPVAASDSRLDAHVDRTQIHENETLTLSLTGSMPLSLNLDSILNLSDMDLPEPDIGPLEEDFEILGRNQKYSIRSVNGETEATITWTYQLSPSSTGELTIPSLTFRDAQSSPIDVEVKAGSGEAKKGIPAQVSLELEADKSSVYVQEQVVITVRLTYRGNLIRGELSEPEIKDAIMESMGKQRDYRTQRQGLQYQVVERRYVLYPQEAGTLTIDDIRFKGRVRNQNGILKFLQEKADPLTIPVTPIPKSFTGDTWLPATSLEVREKWQPEAKSIEIGDNVERTITIDALGLLGSALPPIEPDYPDQVRSYPEKPETESRIQRRSVTSTRSENTTLVAITGGTIQIPEIRIPWWDTVNDQQRVATIPARTLTIEGTPGQAAVEPESSTSPPTETMEETGPQPTGSEKPSPIWRWATIALALLWLVTILIWWRQRGPGQPAASEVPENAREADLFRALQDAVKKSSGRTFALLPQWARARFQRDDLRACADVIRFAGHPDLKPQLDRLQSALYGPADPDCWDPEELIRALNSLRNRRTDREAGQSLPPLYPTGLGRH